MARNHKILFYSLLLICFLANLLQAIYTEVLSDEAYYSLYGRYLAWGYFDHPPLIGLLTGISSLLFSGNLGIRFMSVLLQPFTLILIWKTISDDRADSRKVFSYFIIASSVCMFSVYGSVTTPDVPLLFFTAFFLFVYKKFLDDQGWKNIILLSLSLAGLVYSKYHAVLVIGLVVLSNPKLLKSLKFWLSGFLALILFSPHIWWQISNGFPTIKFHLVDRPEGFRWGNLLEYVPNQLVVFNPLIIGAVFYIMFRQRPKDIFDRALYFLIAGFFLFFGLSAFHDHVEPHWTVASSIAMIILMYNYSIVNAKMHMYIRKALLPSLVIIIVLRVLLVTNLSVIKSFDLNGKKEKFEYIGSVAKDLPVLFLGSFPNPSLYTYFTGKEGLAINSLYSRKTQFDLWEFEKKYNNKPAFICGFGEGNSQLYEKDGFKFYGYATDSLQTVNRIEVKISPGLKVLKSGDSLCLSLILISHYDYDIDFNHKNFPVEVDMAFIKGRELNFIPVSLAKSVNIIRSGETLTRTVRTVVPDLPPGEYRFGITLITLFGPAINDSFTVIKVVK